MLECDTSAALARELHISESTAKKHVGSIMRKLGVRSRHRAVAWGFRLGLVS